MNPQEAQTLQLNEMVIWIPDGMKISGSHLNINIQQFNYLFLASSPTNDRSLGLGVFQISRWQGLFPTVNRSCVIHQNRVLREERGQGGGIVVIPCLVFFLSERENPLA